MKKNLPLILLGVGILVVLGVYLMVKRSKNTAVEEEETAPEIALADRPLASLIPTKDGHWLHLTVDKIKVKAATLEYLLLYFLPDGRTQGVPGTVSLSGVTKVDRDLLLGSESSGKFRYDEGVDHGTLTLKFRDAGGKLVGKLTTTFTLSSPKKGVFAVTMDTFLEGTKTFTSK